MPTYLRILVEKTRAGAELNQDLLDRALGDLLELEKPRGILVVSSVYNKAWDVPRSNGVLHELITAAEAGDEKMLMGIVRARGGMELVPGIHFNPAFYSEVVVA